MQPKSSASRTVNSIRYDKTVQPSPVYTQCALAVLFHVNQCCVHHSLHLQIVSLKKLAPYREDADLIQPNHKMLRKLVGKKRPAAELSFAEATEVASLLPKKAKAADNHSPAEGKPVAPATRKKANKQAVEAEGPTTNSMANKKKKKRQHDAVHAADPEEARRASFVKPGAASWRATYKASVPGKPRRGKEAGQGNSQDKERQSKEAQGKEAGQGKPCSAQPKAAHDGFSRNQRKNYKKRQARRAKHAAL